jgi:hypothetical protein
MRRGLESRVQALEGIKPAEADGTVCWLGGWDRGKVFNVVMVERTNRGTLEAQ